MQTTTKNSVYKNWSIEKGDYVRKGLSQDGSYYKQKISWPIKALIFIMSASVVVLSTILVTKHFHLF